ncbi:MAG: cell division protein ZapB [SAR324 cluster bacterium]|nr:cell division protein ZapB [SAR324 cluster bacterium]
MSNNLLKQLEEKINAAVETIELSRMEITDLKEQNDELQNRYVDWEERLSALIEKFEQLEEGEAVEIEAEAEATIQKVEEESEEVQAEEVEAEEVKAEEEDDTEGPIFGTSADSYTEAPGSAQHYA